MTPWSPIPMTRRRPDNAWSAIPKTRRHPDNGLHALLTNPNDTAPPRPRAGQHSPRHGATERTRCPAIPMAQRRPRDTPTSNPHGTAPHTPHTRHARGPSPQPATAFHGTAPRARQAERSLPMRSKKRPLQAYIHKSTDSLRLPRFRNAHCVNARPHSRFLAQGHEIKRFQLPRTILCACHAKRWPARPPVAPFPRPATRSARLPHTCHVKRMRTNVQMHASPHLPRESTLQCLPECGHASGVPRLPRESHVTARKILRARTRPEPNPHGTAPPTRPASMPPARSQHARSPQPANPHGTAPRHGRDTPATCPRHALNTPDPRSLPRKTMPRSYQSPRLPRDTLAMHAAPQRERRSEPDSRTGREQDSGARFWSIMT